MPFKALSKSNHWNYVYWEIGKYLKNYFLLDFFLDLGDVDWNTLEADIKFSIYCPKTWFSDFSFKFSSLTLSTLWDKSKIKINNWY